MDELSNLINENVNGDSEETFSEVSSMLDDNVDVNSLITWIKVTSVSREIDSDEVLSMAKTFKKRHT